MAYCPVMFTQLVKYLTTRSPVQSPALPRFEYLWDLFSHFVRGESKSNETGNKRRLKSSSNNLIFRIHKGRFSINWQYFSHQWGTLLLASSALVSHYLESHNEGKDCFPRPTLFGILLRVLENGWTCKRNSSQRTCFSKEDCSTYDIGFVLN